MRELLENLSTKFFKKLKRTKKIRTPSVVGYMCSVDFDYELGKAAGGVEVYKSVNDLKKHRHCVDAECGIYEVIVERKKVLKESEI